MSHWLEKCPVPSLASTVLDYYCYCVTVSVALGKPAWHMYKVYEDFPQGGRNCTEWRQVQTHPLKHLINVHQEPFKIVLHPSLVCTELEVRTFLVILLQISATVQSAQQNILPLCQDWSQCSFYHYSHKFMWNYYYNIPSFFFSLQKKTHRCFVLKIKFTNFTLISWFTQCCWLHIKRKKNQKPPTRLPPSLQS